MESLVIEEIINAHRSISRTVDRHRAHVAVGEKDLDAHKNALKSALDRLFAINKVLLAEKMPVFSSERGRSTVYDLETAEYREATPEEIAAG